MLKCSNYCFPSLSQKNIHQNISNDWIIVDKWAITIKIIEIHLMDKCGKLFTILSKMTNKYKTMWMGQCSKGTMKLEFWMNNVWILWSIIKVEKVRNSWSCWSSFWNCFRLGSAQFGSVRFVITIIPISELNFHHDFPRNNNNSIQKPIQSGWLNQQHQVSNYIGISDGKWIICVFV